MHNRPRCCGWLPLSSQQLRLRNLVRVQGFNIDCENSKSHIYYTLHHTQQSPEFYRSEALPARHSIQNWSEIPCIKLQQSNLNCVCVKVWEKFGNATSPNVINDMKNHLKFKHDAKMTNSSVRKKYLSMQLFHCDPLQKPLDKLIFVWGVYFSGLIPMNKTFEPIHCFGNSLIFQLHADFFASAEHLKPDTLREQLEANYNQFHTNSKQRTISSDEFLINSPKVSRNPSPLHFHTEPDGKRNLINLLSMSKARYIDLFCVPSEVRCSYDLIKLLEIQELQRLQVQKYNQILEITSEIKRQCVRCITTDQLVCRKNLSATASMPQHYSHASMGRTLRLLLPDAQQQRSYGLLRMQITQEQIESSHNRLRLLRSECETYSNQIIQLRHHFSALSDKRQQLQESLQKRRSQLAAERLQLEERCWRVQQLLQMKHKILQNVKSCMTSLCIELRTIYPIDSICGISLFHLDNYLCNDQYSAVQVENITSMALSSSLGYLAHLVQVIAIIFERPLRNPIRHEGSTSRIIDLVQDLPLSAREYPLYSRSIILAKPVKYAIYLLNQNIAQLCHDFAGIRRDLRGTIENIVTFFAALSAEEHKETENIQQRIPDSLSNSHSSIHLHNVSLPNLPSVVPLSTNNVSLLIVEHHVPGQRICRSVGSYSDCEEDFNDIPDHSYSNSDSNIMNKNYKNNK